MVIYYITIVFIPAIVLLFLFEYSLYQHDLNAKNQLLERGEYQKVLSQKIYFETVFKNVISDLMYLSEQNRFQFKANSRRNLIHEALTNNHLKFISNKDYYSKYQLINYTGMEKTRLEKGIVATYSVPKDELLFLGREYFFMETLLLDKKEVFITPFNINIEQNVPHDNNRTTISFGTPVFNPAGEKKGIVVLSFKINNFIKHLKEMLTEDLSSIYIINTKTNVLLDPKNAVESGLTFEDKGLDYFKNTHPDLYRYISQKKEGQFYNELGLFTYTTINILIRQLETSPANDERSHEYLQKWKVVSFVKATSLTHLNLLSLMKRFIKRQGFFLILLLFISIVVASLIVNRREIATSLRESEENLRILIDSMPGMICLLDENERWLVSNKMNLTLFGLNGITYRSKTKDELLKLVTCDKDIFNSFYHVEPSVWTKGTMEKEVKYISKNNESKHFDIKKIPLFHKSGMVRGMLLIGWDITKRKQTEEELKIYATTDTMTGVLNRRTGLEILEQYFRLSKRKNQILTICYFDINNLKDTNDNYGHKEGDFMIITVVSVIKNNLRESDIVCRLGGDEFLVIFIDCPEKEAKKIVNRIDEEIDTFNDKELKPYKIIVSRGYAEYIPGEDITIHELISIADVEMYKNKKQLKQNS